MFYPESEGIIFEDFERACLDGDAATARKAVLAVKNKQTFPNFELNVNGVDHRNYTILMRVCFYRFSPHRSLHSGLLFCSFC